MKKILPILLSSILSISLAGCKKEQPGKTEPPGNYDDVIIIEITDALISETLTETETETGTNAAAIETTAAEQTITSAEAASETETNTISAEAMTKASADYILNDNTQKFHYPDCPSVDQMSDKNKRKYSGDRDDLIVQGYEPCKRCEP